MGLILGVDLSGPSNTADSAAAWFRATPEGLSFIESTVGVGDQALVDLALALVGEGSLVIGLDAPLSYNPGGGDRPADADLRRRLIGLGLPPGAVMVPTMTRMAYLTLRGVAVARALALAPPHTKIVEVHPGAAMALRGARTECVSSFKREAEARQSLVEWFATQRMAALPTPARGDHEIAAYGCALAAWQWQLGKPAWIAKATGPLQPYDFAC